MQGTTVLNSISIKIGLLFSAVFLTLLLILCSILYGVFTNLFVDFVTNDLLVRGINHAKALEDDYSGKMIEHVLSMERGGTTQVVITDKNKKILGSSVSPNQEMKNHILKNSKKNSNEILDNDWNKDKYMVTISTVGQNNGYIYLFYPTDVLRETVFVLKMLIIVTSIGTVFLGFGLIGFLSRKITKPLVIMKDATNKIAIGKYRQKIPSKGNDEIAQLSNAIERLGEQLQFYEDSRNEFLTAVSHELRTPLTYIKGYSDILNKGIVKNHEEQTEYLSIINKEATRVAFLVADLFEMSKLQVGEFQLNKDMANVNSIIERVAMTLRPVAEKKGIKLDIKLSPQIPEIDIDYKRIEQVIYNIIENAIKYTDYGEVKVHSYLQNEYVMIEINDSGIGIPKQEIPKIWDRFYRIDKSRARKTGGSGLGLYIAKQIVNSHNGEIMAKSIENHGSTFMIYLPKK
ncbi:ATP-binding protein [Neobacillus sp. PS3-40]|uniref:sensor histidine kinase n=1 Tax=Neobacillus sp. PS3-40 TaxID=3070679 RepID=UPI0027E1F14F|nr:ATP-binding protein [Neobacillus sp. PS3-40]WML43198.1 ATP-binding protein [Neobacillus sp. PS3-40]